MSLAHRVGHIDTHRVEAAVGRKLEDIGREQGDLGAVRTRSHDGDRVGIEGGVRMARYGGGALLMEADRRQFGGAVPVSAMQRHGGRRLYDPEHLGFGLGRRRRKGPGKQGNCQNCHQSEFTHRRCVASINETSKCAARNCLRPSGSLCPDP